MLQRVRALVSGKADSEILEGGLILVVLISIVSVGPAVWSQNADLVREQTIELVLATIATALCLIERSNVASAGNANPAVVTQLAAPPRGTPWSSPFR
jgi:hypothetical protein